MAMDELTIGEVARRAGIRTSTLRYYEQIGLLPPPERTNGRRRYDPSVLDRLRVIHMAQEVGFRLDEIQELFPRDGVDQAFSARWHPMAQQKLAEVDALIARAQMMKQMLEESLRCGCMNLEECMVFLRQARRASKQTVDA
jgi:MerR family transcriptional regulator, redox-sensitive transcriptional activator SoxR